MFYVMTSLVFFQGWYIAVIGAKLSSPSLFVPRVIRTLLYYGEIVLVAEIDFFFQF